MVTKTKVDVDSKMVMSYAQIDSAWKKNKTGFYFESTSFR